MERLLGQYFPMSKVRNVTGRSLAKMELVKRERISIIELMELHQDIERALAGSIGAAAAYHAMRRGLSFTREEQKARPISSPRRSRP